MQVITMNDGNKIPQLGYGVFQMSSDEAAGHLLGRAVAEQADESILADDVVDLGKLSPSPSTRPCAPTAPSAQLWARPGARECLSGKPFRPADVPLGTRVNGTLWCQCTIR